MRKQLNSNNSRWNFSRCDIVRRVCTCARYRIDEDGNPTCACADYHISSQIDRKIAGLVARQQALQGRAEVLRRMVEANRRCPRAEWQVL